MDPFYFTTDLDYAFGVNSGFNPETDVNVQTARKTASAKNRPVRSATKKAPKRANYDGMSFEDAFAAAKRAGKATFNWRGKSYTTQIDEGPTLPYTEIEPFTVERLDHPDFSVVRDALAVQSDGSNALNKVANPYLGMRLPVQAQAIRGYGYGGCILPDIILY